MPTNYVQKKRIPKSGSMGRKPPISRKRGGLRRPIIIIVLILLIAGGIFGLSRLGVLNFGGEQEDDPVSSSVSGLEENPEEGLTSPGDGTGTPADTGGAGTLPQESLDDLSPATERDISNAEVDTLNTMMIVGNSGYRYYDFSENNSQTYVDTITSAGKQLTGKATVYNMVCPTATDIMLSQIFLVDKSTSDQQKAIDYIYASINTIEPSVKTIKLYEALKAHCDEDIYFRTDRNWTALGAYYAYRQFAKEKGVEPVLLDNWEKVEYSGFRGSMYSQSGERSELSEGETLVAYKPPYETTVTVTNSSGETSESSLITDVTDYDSNMKYCAFLGGDYTYTAVKNKSITDGSSCIVVEETMGTAMVPFLSAHYENVFVVDYRYWANNIVAFATEKGASDIIFINSIEHTSDSEANAELRGLLS